MSVIEELEIAIERLAHGGYFPYTPRIETLGQFIDKVLELADNANIFDVMDEYKSLESYSDDIRSMEIDDERIDENESMFERIPELANQVMDIVDDRN